MIKRSLDNRFEIQPECVGAGRGDCTIISFITLILVIMDQQGGAKGIIHHGAQNIWQIFISFTVTPS